MIKCNVSIEKVVKYCASAKIKADGKQKWKKIRRDLFGHSVTPFLTPQPLAQLLMCNMFFMALCCCFKLKTLVRDKT